MRRVVWMSVILWGCGMTNAPSHDGGLDAGPGRVDGGDSVDAGACAPVTCELACEHGFVRGPDGCERCECNPPPVEACVADAECVLARDATSCCSCERGYPRAQLDADPCLVERGERAPAGCLPDPELCARIDCAACEAVVRAVCEAGTCSASAECPPGELVFRQSCVPPCASHADCTLGAGYGECCGGCTAAPRAYFDDDPCFRERASDTMCAPAPGSCDGLGCPSPATDCVQALGTAVCLADGTCLEGGATGACPSTHHEEAGVCVPH